MFKHTFHFIATVSIFFTCSVDSFAQHGGHPGHGGFGFTPFRGMSRPPVIMPATVARQSALPLFAPPVSPYLARGYYRNGIGGYGRYGGYGGYGFGGYYFPFYGGFYPGYGYGYGYNNPNMIFNYNLAVPAGYVPSPNLAVPPPAPNDHPTTARLTLTVPTGAEVYLQDKKIEMPVTTRTFESPELKSGEDYQFNLRVIWHEGTKLVEEKKLLAMHAGEHQSLQYLALPAAPTRLAEKK